MAEWLDEWTHEWYLKRLASYPKRHPYAGPTPRKPKPPYAPEEVPEWYPAWLRTYLTTVSRESVYGYHPTIVHVPEDPTVSLEQRLIDAVSKLESTIAEEGAEVYFAHDIKSHPDMSIAEIKRMAIANAKMAEAGIQVGEGGCVFSDECDARTGVIYNQCGDDYNYGEVDLYRNYNGRWQSSPSRGATGGV